MGYLASFGKLASGRAYWPAARVSGERNSDVFAITAGWLALAYWQSGRN